MTIQLYNQKDINALRDLLLAEQDEYCLLSGKYLKAKDAVLDHDHETMFVRGVINRQANAALGKIENIYKRYLAHWYDGDIKDFMRDSITYLNKTKYNFSHYHPHWIKKSKTEFNKLNERSKSLVLKKMGIETTCSNAKERKDAFGKALMTKKYKYQNILQWIKNESN